MRREEKKRYEKGRENKRRDEKRREEDRRLDRRYEIQIKYDKCLRNYIEICHLALSLMFIAVNYSEIGMLGRSHLVLVH